MTKIAKVSLVVLMGSSILLANQIKMYDVKSGKIEYEIKGSGNMMGMTINTIGKKRVIFTANGAQNLTEENKVTKQTMSGETKTTKNHTMAYIKEGMIYQVDFDSKRIVRIENMAVAMGVLMGGENNMMQAGEAMMKQMGGKKTGTDTVLGYTCNTWNIMGTKQCIYKGIPLRVETDVMGIKNVELATKINFDISVTPNDFKLPDFPIYDMQCNKLDKNNLDAMDKKAQEDMEKSAQKMVEMRQIMAEAAKKAGIKEGQRPTKAQEQDMEQAIMAVMLPRMKQKMLSEEKALRFGKECFSKADTLKEANECNHKAITLGWEDEEDFDNWNPQMKKQVLGFIEQGLEGVKCIKNAQTTQAAKQCMPY